MAQDLRKMFQEDSDSSVGLSKGHEARFATKLEERMGDQKKQNGMFFFMKIAAAVVVFLGLAFAVNQYFKKGDGTNSTTIAETEEVSAEDENRITMGDISPDLKKIEDFYTAGINVQIASLPMNDSNKELIDGYMIRLNELNAEYTRLNDELNEVGPTEATINALVDNLKLRLELLFKLKNKLKELKNLDNEQFNSLQS